jgi:PqqD family protein of HPr-rel-A system
LNALSIGAISWQAANVSQFTWRTWDGEHVLFHRPSGTIHLLNDASLRLLTELLAEPKSTQDVISDLAGASPSPEEVDQIVSLLIRFDIVGLVTSQ